MPDVLAPARPGPARLGPVAMCNRIIKEEKAEGMFRPDQPCRGISVRHDGVLSLPPFYVIHDSRLS